MDDCQVLHFSLLLVFSFCIFHRSSDGVQFTLVCEDRFPASFVEMNLPHAVVRPQIIDAYRFGSLLRLEDSAEETV